MLTFTRKQENELADLELQKFNDKVFKHLKGVWTEECQLMGDDQVRESIDLGLSKARMYGISTEYDTTRFIDLMYAISFDFDHGTPYDWVPEILTKLDWQPFVKMKLIHSKLKRHLAAM